MAADPARPSNENRFAEEVVFNNDLWDWLMDQQRDQLLSVLAFAAAHSVNAVELKYSGDRKQAFADADQLGQALDVKMGDYFTPTSRAISAT